MNPQVPIGNMFIRQIVGRDSHGNMQSLAGYKITGSIDNYTDAFANFYAAGGPGNIGVGVCNRPGGTFIGVRTTTVTIHAVDQNNNALPDVSFQVDLVGTTPPPVATQIDFVDVTPDLGAFPFSDPGQSTFTIQ